MVRLNTVALIVSLISLVVMLMLGWPRGRLSPDLHSETQTVPSSGGWEYSQVIINKGDIAATQVEEAVTLSGGRLEVVDVRTTGTFRLVEGWENTDSFRLKIDRLSPGEQVSVRVIAQDGPGAALHIEYLGSNEGRFEPKGMEFPVLPAILIALCALAFFPSATVIYPVVASTLGPHAAAVAAGVGPKMGVLAGLSARLTHALFRPFATLTPPSIGSAMPFVAALAISLPFTAVSVVRIEHFARVWDERLGQQQRLQTQVPRQILTYYYEYERALADQP